MPILDGSSYASFVIRLSQAAIEPVSIEWRTESVTALPGQDYAETSGTAHFLPSETEKTVQVLVYGRAPGDDDPREFRLHLLPAPNVVLGASTRNCIITVRDEDDVVVSTVTVANGETGLNAYQVAQLQGFEGSPLDWIESLKVKGDTGDKGDEGDSAAKQFYDAGYIPDATVPAMFGKLADAGAQAGLAAVTPAVAAAAEAAGISEASALRAEAARDIVLTNGTIYDTAEVGRLATAPGDKFRALMPGNVKVGLYNNDGATASLLFTFLSGEDITDEQLARRRDIALTGAVTRKLPPYFAHGVMVLEDARLPDGSVVATHAIDPILGHRTIAGLALPGFDAPVVGGKMPLIADRDGRPVLTIDVIDRTVNAPGPVYGLLTEPAKAGMRPTETSPNGQANAGYTSGRYYRFEPRVLDGLTIQGDHNKVPQLWSILEGPVGSALTKRQLTYSQYGVTDFNVISMPAGSTPGLLRIQSNDHDLIRDRHKVRYAHWHESEPFTPPPTKLVYIVVIGQSNSVGAGSYGTNPANIKGPQTVRTAMPTRNGQFASRLLTWNGGTIPHQGNLDGDVNIGGGVLARTVPIDPVRIATLVPMCEGLGATGQHFQGGATRESFITALATHLNGPNGYDGSAYIAGASFGFGSSSFAQLIHDGVSRQQAWLNALASIDQAKVLAMAKGLPLEVHVLLDQGEADWSSASYGTQLAAGWVIMSGDITARTGQAAAPQLFVHQTIQARGSFAEPAYSALAQIDVALDHANIHILPPHYFTDFDTDTVHYKSVEETWRGALSGEAIADWLIRGQTSALYMTSAKWSGSLIRATFNHPVMLDAETISLTVGNGGASHINSNGPTASVTRVRLDPANPNDLLIDLSSAIAGGAAETVRIAWGNQTTANPPSQGWGGGPSGGGQRSIFRRADWERFSLIDGRPLPIFANIQQITATQE